MDLKKLIDQCREKNINAQSLLYKAFYHQMLGLCISIIHNRQEAEETVQNGFLKAFQKIESFRYKGVRSISNWLNKIMVYECRNSQRHKKLPFLPITESSKIETGEDIIGGIDAEIIISSLVSQLPGGCKFVFQLHVIEKMEIKEIARYLKITVATVRGRIKKAREILAKRIKKIEGFKYRFEGNRCFYGVCK